MSSVIELVTEIDCLTDYIHAQQSLNLPDFDVDKMISSLATSMVAKIGLLRRMDAGDARKLITAITAGAYSVEGRTMISHAIR